MGAKLPQSLFVLFSVWKTCGYDRIRLGIDDIVGGMVGVGRVLIRIDRVVLVRGDPGGRSVEVIRRRFWIIPRESKQLAARVFQAKGEILRHFTKFHPFT